MGLPDFKIEKLREEDFTSAFLLIKEVILDNIKIEKLSFSVDYILEKQKERLKKILENPKLGEFIVAKNKNEIIGMIGFGPIGEVIKDGLKNQGIKSEKMVEIIAAFIKPSSQSKGIGTLLFKTIIKLLKEKQIDSFSLQTGYQKGINFWTKKLGKETIFLENYYNNQADAYIWIRKLNQIKI